MTRPHCLKLYKVLCIHEAGITPSGRYTHNYTLEYTNLMPKCKELYVNNEMQLGNYYFHKKTAKKLVLQSYIMPYSQEWKQMCICIWWQTKLLIKNKITVGILQYNAQPKWPCYQTFLLLRVCTCTFCDLSFCFHF